MTNNQTTNGREKYEPPKVIYLQIHDEDGEEAEEISWCDTRINDSDVKYIISQ